MNRTDRASLVIDASVARVFAALVDVDALEQWLPPTGMTGTFDHFDPRAGGSYRLVLTYVTPPEGGGKSSLDSDIVEGRFIDVVEDVRVVQQVDFVSDDPAFAGTMTMTWAVEAVNSGTRVDFIADDVPEGISDDDHREGMTSSLRQLAAHLEAC